jgi:hypothetical protein
MAGFRWYGDCVYGTGRYKGRAPVIDPPQSAAYYFSFLPNWEGGIDLSYEYRTTIEESRLNAEQRKSLVDRPYRVQKVSLLEAADYTDIQNFLESNHGRTFYVPIYSEPMLPIGSGSMAGQSAFTVPNTAEFYNLRTYPSFVMLIDFVDQIRSEVHAVDSITDTVLTLETAVGDFEFARCVFYPAMVAYLDAKSITDQTDTVTEMDLTLREWF